MTKLSQDALAWLAALDEIPRTAGEVARRAGHGRGMPTAFAHFAKSHPELVTREFTSERTGPRFLYRKAPKVEP